MANTSKRPTQSDLLKDIIRLAKLIDGTLQMKDDILADPLKNRNAGQALGTMPIRFQNVRRELEHINQTLVKYTKPQEKPVERVPELEIK